MMGRLNSYAMAQMGANPITANLVSDRYQDIEYRRIKIWHVRLSQGKIGGQV